MRTLVKSALALLLVSSGLGFSMTPAEAASRTALRDTAIYSSTSTSASKVGSVRKGARVNFSCYRNGASVTGPYGTSKMWLSVDNHPGKWVPDAWVYTGSNSAVVPHCFSLRTGASDWYEIVTPTGKLLDVRAGKAADGTPIQQYGRGQVNAQAWRFVPTGGGWYRIVSKVDGRSIDVKGRSTTNGTRLQTWMANASNPGTNQQWRIVLVNSTGLMQLRPRHVNKCLDVPKSQVSMNGALPTIWDCHTGSNQRFTLRTWTPKVVSYPDGDAVCAETKSRSGLCPSSVWLKGGKAESPRKYYYRNCTDFVAWRTQQSAGRVVVPPGWGNARTWDDFARRAGRTISSTPRVGDIAQTDAGVYGHVAVVAEVRPGQVRLEEYNGAPAFYGTYTNYRWVSTSSYRYIRP